MSTTAIALSALDLFYVGWGVVGAAALLLALLMARYKPKTPDLPETWGSAPDDLAWERAAEKVPHESLVKIRETAKSWGETIGTLLGVFTIVAFVKGPETFTDVKGDEAEAAALLVLFAAVLAGAAVILAASAAQGVPRAVENLDGWALRYHTARRAQSAVWQLAASRALAVIAALIVLGSIGLTWLAALDERDAVPDAKPQAILVPEGTEQGVCGELRAAAGRLSVVPDGGEPVPVKNGDLLAVDSCPASP